MGANDTEKAETPVFRQEIKAQCYDENTRIKSKARKVCVARHLRREIDLKEKDIPEATGRWEGYRRSHSSERPAHTLGVNHSGEGLSVVWATQARGDIDRLKPVFYYWGYYLDGAFLLVRQDNKGKPYLEYDKFGQLTKRNAEVPVAKLTGSRKTGRLVLEYWGKEFPDWHDSYDFVVTDNSERPRPTLMRSGLAALPKKNVFTPLIRHFERSPLHTDQIGWLKARIDNDLAVAVGKGSSKTYQWDKDYKNGSLKGLREMIEETYKKMGKDMPDQISLKSLINGYWSAPDSKDSVGKKERQDVANLIDTFFGSDVFRHGVDDGWQYRYNRTRRYKIYGDDLGLAEIYGQMYLLKDKIISVSGRSGPAIELLQGIVSRTSQEYKPTGINYVNDMITHLSLIPVKEGENRRYKYKLDMKMKGEGASSSAYAAAAYEVEVKIIKTDTKTGTGETYSLTGAFVDGGLSFDLKLKKKAKKREKKKDDVPEVKGADADLRFEGTVYSPFSWTRQNFVGDFYAMQLTVKGAVAKFRDSNVWLSGNGEFTHLNFDTSPGIEWDLNIPGGGFIGGWGEITTAAGGSERDSLYMRKPRVDVFNTVSENVHFNLGSAKVTDQGLEILRKFCAEELVSLMSSGSSLIITGQADRKDTLTNNQQLSELRARNTLQHIMAITGDKFGIPFNGYEPSFSLLTPGTFIWPLGEWPAILKRREDKIPNPADRRVDIYVNYRHTLALFSGKQE